jgi:nitrous oxidase accessory protein NosD
MKLANLCAPAALASALLFALPAAAATINVTCPGQSLQAAINSANSGDTINVTGTCTENIGLPAGKYLTLDGGNSAILTAASGTVVFMAPSSTLKRFTVRGGQVAVGVHHVRQPAWIQNNIIELAAGQGIFLVNSYAIITGNTIRRNDVSGIHVVSNSSAVVDDNLIVNNGNGVIVDTSSEAGISNNTIKLNAATGVTVKQVSYAAVRTNFINDNGDNGIVVTGNSSVDFASGNTTTVSNGAYGLRCEVNSSAGGTLGTLNGTQGAKRIVTGCVDRTGL